MQCLVLAQSRNFSVEPESQLVHFDGVAAVHSRHADAGSQKRHTFAAGSSAGDTAVATASPLSAASLAEVLYMVAGHVASQEPDDVAANKMR